MANYKNQKLITDISVEKIKHYADVKEAWMQPFSWEKMTIPLFLLSGNEFKVYMYLFSWAGKGEYEFSPADILNKLNIKEDTARKTFNNFIKYGYLVEVKPLRYRFDPAPEQAIHYYKEKYYEVLREKVV